MTYLILHLGPLTTLLQGLQEGLQLCSPFYFVVRTTNSPAGEILPCHFKAWRHISLLEPSRLPLMMSAPTRLGPHPLPHSHPPPPPPPTLTSNHRPRAVVGG
jgi:hypothetical protein